MNTLTLFPEHFFLIKMHYYTSFFLVRLQQQSTSSVQQKEHRTDFEREMELRWKKLM